MTTVAVGDIEHRRNRNGQAAVASVRLGWQVLPWLLLEGRKVPQIRGWQAGAAFASEDDVRAWWGINFGHSPGIVCGAESRLWVLDVDPRNGGDVTLQRLVAEYGGLPSDTFMVTTPGGGWHYYFEWGSECAGLRKHRLAYGAGLDVIAEGGWVAAPGSWSDAGRYDLVAGGSELRTAPPWLVSMAFAANPNAPEDGADWSGEDGSAGPDEWLASEVVRIGATPAGGQRSALLAFTASLRRRGYARSVADRAAVEAMSLLLIDQEKGPWSEVDVLAMVAGAWTKYRPADVSAVESAWAESPGLVQVAESPPSSAEGPAIPVEVAPALPPPLGPAVLGEPPESVGPDDENGVELRTFADGRLLWLGDIGWLIWDGQRWVEDDMLRRHQIIREFGHEIIRQAAASGVDEYTALMRRANRLGMVQGRDACLNYARDSFAVRPQLLDADPMVLNTPTGLVDLRTGAVRPSRPGDLVSQITAGGFVPGAVDDIWEQVLRERVPDERDRDWLQRWMGYCLTGLDTEKAILAMHGPANTGKSTVTEPFARAMGAYAIGWSAETIVANSRVNVQEALYRAKGVRVVTVNEMKVGTRLDEGVIKAATGGDTIVARALYKGSIEYRGQFKLWVHTNHVPDTRDDALLQRMLFLEMGSQVAFETRQPWMKTWLEESEGAQAAILWWAWEGLGRMMDGGRMGRLGKPPGSDEAVEEHALRSDPVRRFLRDVVTVGERDDVLIWDELYGVYIAWCSAEQVKPMGPTKLQWALRERGMEKGRLLLTDGRRVMGYRGWKMATTTESGWTSNV